ncbi:diguanylate cyclase [Hoeflea sp. G2-23]|uniref:diguanylate cyclase n=1 Tax=Hoeflea algicola TaxID=2983763 RepID=A0ABT3Z3I0_9HYPH|nr:diguanylate cyclase [Hoeflea algicola]MCY0146281.1 diguanylate cyclase [Hoeflea algicola]
MPGYPLPDRETERLAKLQKYTILDSLPEAAYDRITRLASHMLKVPIALVTLVDSDRQWFKSKVGIDVQETPRDISMCAHTICRPDVFVVEDTTLDERFRDNPMVIGEPGVRFYAGAPLNASDGLILGTLCVADRVPRTLSEMEKSLLVDLAAIIADALETRLLLERAEKAENRLSDAMECLPSGFVLFDKEDRLVLCNSRYREIYSRSADVIKPGALFEDMVRTGVERGQYPQAAGKEDAWIASHVQVHQNPGEPTEQYLPDDRYIQVHNRRTGEGGLVGFRIDISEKKRQEQALALMAWTDGLTGALNRRRFFELATIEIGRARREEAPMSLLLLDADHFKKINDRDGHAAGDRVLEGLVARWEAELRPHDMIGRVGGEEFCVLLPGMGEAEALRAAERLRAAIADLPFAVEGQLIRVTVSAGIATLNADDTLETLMKRADMGLYEAKEAGRNRFAVYAA